MKGDREAQGRQSTVQGETRGRINIRKRDTEVAYEGGAIEGLYSYSYGLQTGCYIIKYSNIGYHQVCR